MPVNYQYVMNDGNNQMVNRQDGIKLKIAGRKAKGADLLDGVNVAQ